MLGYDVSWAAFNIVEVMSSSKFTYKVWLHCFSWLSTSQIGGLLWILPGSYAVRVNIDVSADGWKLALLLAEDWLLGSLAVLSWEHRCHHANNQSDPKGQWSTCFVHLDVHASVWSKMSSRFFISCLFNFHFLYYFPRRISVVPTSTTQVLP